MTVYPPEATVTAAADRQVSTNLAGVVVILGLEDGFYYQLEGVGVRIWELLQAPRRVADLIEQIVSEYDVPPQTADADLQRLLDDLVAHRLVHVDVPGDSSRGSFDRA